MEKELVIFGASGGGVKVAQTLQSFGIDFHCFLDNSPGKWGTVLEDKRIESPDILLHGGYRIIIASEYQAEIEKQLDEMGQLENLLLKEELLLPETDALLPSFQPRHSDWKKEEIPERPERIIIDLMEGVQLGGIETWTYRVTRELKKTGYPVMVYAKETDMQPEDDIADCFQYFDLDYRHFREDVLLLAEALLKELPCKVVINKHTQLLYAAYLVKQFAGDAVKILSIVHNDTVVWYRRHKALADILDTILCVSSRIQKTLTEQYGLSDNKVCYRPSPVYCDEILQRTYTLDRKEPIHLGYAARLTKFQKRADLLIQLIEELEEQNCNYFLSIAGDGPYFGKLQDFIAEKNLGQKVRLLGYLNADSIEKFWKTQDVFVSVSDFEGVGLSMLEAMAQGVVPIETNVAGAEDFIIPNQNGYYVEVGNVQMLADCICRLEKNREKMQDMGMCSHEIIKEKCDPAGYGAFIVK